MIADWPGHGRHSINRADADGSIVEVGFGVRLGLTRGLDGTLRLLLIGLRAAGRLDATPHHFRPADGALAFPLENRFYVARDGRLADAEAEGQPPLKTVGQVVAPGEELGYPFTGRG